MLVRLPDPVTLGRDPDSETGLAGMQTLLLLVLGCAVQGPSKESVIEDIKRLPLATQHDIVNCIQQVNNRITNEKDNLFYLSIQEPWKKTFFFFQEFLPHKEIFLYWQFEQREMC